MGWCAYSPSKPGAPFLLARQDRPAQEFRIHRVLEIPDVQDHRAESRLPCTGIEQARLLGPVAFVGANDQRAAATRSAVVGRRAGNFRYQRNLRGVAVPRGDVEDLELELLARVKGFESGSRVSRVRSRRPPTRSGSSRGRRRSGCARRISASTDRRSRGSPCRCIPSSR